MSACLTNGGLVWPLDAVEMLSRELIASGRTLQCTPRQARILRCAEFVACTGPRSSGDRAVERMVDRRKHVVQRQSAADDQPVRKGKANRIGSLWSPPWRRGILRKCRARAVLRCVHRRSSELLCDRSPMFVCLFVGLLAAACTMRSSCCALSKDSTRSSSAAVARSPVAARPALGRTAASTGCSPTVRKTGRQRCKAPTCTTLADKLTFRPS